MNCIIKSMSSLLKQSRYRLPYCINAPAYASACRTAGGRDRGACFILCCCRALIISTSERDYKVFISQVLGKLDRPAGPAGPAGPHASLLPDDWMYQVDGSERARRRRLPVLYRYHKGDRGVREVIQVLQTWDCLIDITCALSHVLILHLLAGLPSM